MSNPTRIDVDYGQRCVQCGRDTSFGSGLFVNRISADREFEREDGVIELRDGFLCPECQELNDAEFEREAIEQG
jgi:hypothetical protein